MESPDPELNARKELLRILCEEQHGGIFKIPIAIYETKTCQHIRNAMPPLCNFKTLCVSGFTEKVLDGCGVDIIHRSPIAHEVIPCAPQLLQDELLQCDARQLLMCRSTTIMVNPMIGDRDATWRNVNLYCIASIAYHKIDIRHYAKKRNNLVWNILHQFLGICDADGSAGIIHANDQLAALRIGKAANPLQVLVVPRLLEFYCLCFAFHTINPFVL